MPSSFEFDSSGKKIDELDALAELVFAAKEDDDRSTEFETWLDGGRIGEAPELGDNHVGEVKRTLVEQGRSIPEVNVLSERAYKILEAVEQESSDG